MLFETGANVFEQLALLPSEQHFHVILVHVYTPLSTNLEVSSFL